MRSDGVEQVEELELIASYLKLERKIAILKNKLANVSKLYYASHSFTGGMLSRNEITAYQSTISPLNATISIVERERLLISRIDYLTFKYKHFQRYLSTLTTDEIEALNREDIFTDTHKKAYEEIQEIEEASNWRKYGQAQLSNFEYTEKHIALMSVINNEISEIFGELEDE